MSDEESQALIDAAVTKLSEHFGAVQIVASRLAPTGLTLANFGGSGDWYARRGLCQAFVERDQAVTTARALSQQNPPDEGEDWKAPKP